MLLLKEMREADVGAPTPYLLTNSYFFVIEYLSVDKKKPLLALNSGCA